MKYTKTALLSILATCALLSTSCGNDDEKQQETTYLEKSDTNVNANDPTGDPSSLRWEIPHLNEGFDYITHYTSDDKLNYVIEYSKQAMHSHWIAYRYDSELAARNTTRSDAWASEPYYNTDRAHQLTTDYFPGYSRGHLIGSAERLYSQQANQQTFYMSNMSPQLSNFNTDYWGEIETLVRDWGRACAAQDEANGDLNGDTLYVVKGGMIDDDNIIEKITLKNTAGGNVQTVVPKYYFIALLHIATGGDIKAIGFWLEHKDFNNTSAEFLKQMRRGAACSIDELEEKTGIDFFCNLPDWIENYVESSYTISSWNGL